MKSFPVGRNVKATEGYLAINFEVASSNSFRNVQNNHFVTAAKAAADIDDSIGPTTNTTYLIYRQ